MDEWPTGYESIQVFDFQPSTDQLQLQLMRQTHAYFVAHLDRTRHHCFLLPSAGQLYHPIEERRGEPSVRIVRPRCTSVVFPAF